MPEPAQSRPTQADELDRMVADIGIPPCPAVLTKLMREARADEPDFGRIATLIGSDVGLSAAMLKLANSAMYGSMGAPLDSIRQAVMRVGMNNTLQVMTGLLLRQAFPAYGCANLEHLELFWASSSRIATLSMHIATQVGSKQAAADRELAYTFSLFRNCGTALMLLRYPDYPRLVAAGEKIGRRLTDVEDVRYGFNHAQVGYELARSWLKNEELSTAVLHHHSPDALCGRRSDLPPACMRLIAIAALAECVYHLEAGETPGKEVAAAGAYALLQFGLAQTALDEFARDAERVDT